MSVDVLIVEDFAQQKLLARCSAAALQRLGTSVRLVDLNDGLAAIVSIAQTELPRLVIFSLLFADGIDDHLALMAALRSQGLRAHLTLMGHLPTLNHARFLEACPALDSVLRGDPETWAPLLARCVAGTGNWQIVPGIALRSPVPTPQLKSQPDTCLHNYPEPLREQLSSFRGYPFATIESSRGCYHACSFCLPSAASRALGAPYRARSTARVVDEIELLYRRGARLFLFDDDEFLPPAPARSQRIEEFAAELERRDLEIAFTIKCRADDVESVSFQRLKHIGLLRVYLGVESGCQATLDLLDKHTTPQQNVQALKILQGLGIVADYRCLLFHPWTTLETIEMDISFLREVLVHSLTLFDVRELQVYEGTPVAHRLRFKSQSFENYRPPMGPISYIIADPRAELMRRLGRVVFEASAPLQQVRLHVTEEWYVLLLERRFGHRSYSARDELNLMRAVTQLNDAFTQLGSEMLRFVHEEDIPDQAAFNARASHWAMKLNSSCVIANLSKSFYIN